MKRRTLLSVTGVSLTPFSGCFGADSPVFDNGTSDGEDRDGSPEDEIIATVASVSIRSVDDDPELASPDEYGLEINANVITATATVETPARIRVSVENGASEPLTVSTGNAGAVVPYRQSAISYEPHLFLFPPASEVERHDDTCWKTEWPVYLDSIGDVTFEANADVHREFDLWGYHGDDECLPSREYEIRQQYSLPEKSIDWRVLIEFT